MLENSTQVAVPTPRPANAAGAQRALARLVRRGAGQPRMREPRMPGPGSSRRGHSPAPSPRDKGIPCQGFPPQG